PSVYKGSSEMDNQTIADRFQITPESLKGPLTDFHGANDGTLEEAGQTYETTAKCECEA
ncbi:hypothetical protein STEG23_015816, partial [Scotinomys teguina]